MTDHSHCLQGQFQGILCERENLDVSIQVQGYILSGLSQDTITSFGHGHSGGMSIQDSGSCTHSSQSGFQSQESSSDGLSSSDSSQSGVQTWKSEIGL